MEGHTTVTFSYLQKVLAEYLRSLLVILTIYDFQLKASFNWNKPWTAWDIQSSKVTFLFQVYLKFAVMKAISNKFFFQLR